MSQMFASAGSITSDIPSATYASSMSRCLLSL